MEKKILKKTRHAQAHEIVKGSRKWRKTKKKKEKTP